jgi:hypothetical protein
MEKGNKKTGIFHKKAGGPKASRSCEGFQLSFRGR